ncbi:MAG: NAD-dependent epimerase/dehydratase family protein [Xanthobacteraceae bacterium]
MSQTLVTGGSGFIGQHLITSLLARGRRVRILDLRPPTCAPAGVQYINGSVLDRERVREALEDVEEVYHLAGLPGMWMPHKEDFHAVNCQGTEVVIDAARTRGVLRFLHCSTESILFGPVGGQPTVTEHVHATVEEMPGTYTRSKMLAEQKALQAAASGFPVVIANPTMPIGPHGGNLTPPTLMLQHFLSRRIQIYLNFVMNLVDVRDVATGLCLVMERGQRGQRYILGGENITLKKLLAIVGVISDRSALRIPIPAMIAQISAVALEFIADHVAHGPPAATVEGVRIALRSKGLSIERAQHELGYTPRPIGVALTEAVECALTRLQQSTSHKVARQSRDHSSERND